MENYKEKSTAWSSDVCLSGVGRLKTFRRQQPRHNRHWYRLNPIKYHNATPMQPQGRYQRSTPPPHTKPRPDMRLPRTHTQCTPQEYTYAFNYVPSLFTVSFWATGIFAANAPASKVPSSSRSANTFAPAALIVACSVWCNTGSLYLMIDLDCKLNQYVMDR